MYLLNTQHENRTMHLGFTIKLNIGCSDIFFMLKHRITWTWTMHLIIFSRRSSFIAETKRGENIWGAIGTNRFGCLRSLPNICFAWEEAPCSANLTGDMYFSIGASIKISTDWKVLFVGWFCRSWVTWKKTVLET